MDGDDNTDLLVHLAGHVGAQQSGFPSNPLHLAGHSPQSEASAHSTSHLGTQHLKFPENSSHPASQRPAAAASWQRSQITTSEGGEVVPGISEDREECSNIPRTSCCISCSSPQFAPQRRLPGPPWGSRRNSLGSLQISRTKHEEPHSHYHHYDSSARCAHYSPVSDTDR